MSSQLDGDRAVGLQKKRKSETALVAIFAVILISVTLLQKIGYSPDGVSAVPITVPMTLLALIAGVLFARPLIDPISAALFGLFLIASGLSVMTQTDAYSGKSYLLYLLIYAPFMLKFRVSEETFKRGLRVFSNVVLVVAAVVLLEDIVQFAVGPDYLPNLDNIIPKIALVPHYNYVQVIGHGSHFIKPNAIVFLEVSLVSQFIAIALAIELLYFHRTYRFVCFAIALFGCFAGTGLLLLALTLPVLMSRVSLRTMTIFLVAAVAIIFAAVEFGWLNEVAPRLDEYQRTGTSANSRFVAPIFLLAECNQQLTILFKGVGPGNLNETGFVWWPFAKATAEYGYFTSIAFYAFLLYSVFSSAPSKRLAFMIVIWYSFEAGLIVPVNAFTMMLLCSMWRVSSEPDGRNRSKVRRVRRSAVPPSVPSANPA